MQFVSSGDSVTDFLKGTLGEWSQGMDIKRRHGHQDAEEGRRREEARQRREQHAHALMLYGQQLDDLRQRHDQSAQDQARQNEEAPLRKRALEQGIAANDYALQRQKLQDAVNPFLGGGAQPEQTADGEDPSGDLMMGRGGDAGGGGSEQSVTMMGGTKIPPAVHAILGPIARNLHLMEPSVAKQVVAAAMDHAREVTVHSHADELDAQIKDYAGMAGEDGQATEELPEPQAKLLAKEVKLAREEADNGDWRGATRRLDAARGNLEKVKKANAKAVSDAEYAAGEVDVAKQELESLRGVIPGEQWGAAREEIGAIERNKHLTPAEIDARTAKVRAMLRGGKKTAANETGAKKSRFSELSPEDRAFEVWQKLPESQRTSDGLIALTQQYSENANARSVRSEMATTGANQAAVPGPRSQGAAQPTPAAPQQIAPDQIEPGIAQAIQSKQIDGSPASIEAWLRANVPVEGAKSLSAALGESEKSQTRDRINAKNEAEMARAQASGDLGPVMEYERKKNERAWDQAHPDPRHSGGLGLVPSSDVRAYEKARKDERGKPESEWKSHPSKPIDRPLPDPEWVAENLPPKSSRRSGEVSKFKTWEEYEAAREENRRKYRILKASEED